MKVKLLKDVAFVLLLSILLLAIPSYCDEHGAEEKTNLTKSSNNNSTRSTPGLEMMKVVAPGKENSPESNAGEEADGQSALNAEEKGEEKEEAGNLATIQGNNSEEEEEKESSEKKVNHESEFRSNSTSPPAATAVHEELEISGKHPLFPALGNDGAHTLSSRNKSVATSSDDGMDKHSGEAESAHDHVEKYQLHQAEEDESKEELELEAQEHPLPSQVKGQTAAAGSEAVVTSDSIPVRVGPNTRLRGNFNGNYGLRDNVNEAPSGFRRPFPVVRRDQIQTQASGGDNGGFGFHH